MPEDDLVLGDPIEKDGLDVIDNQLVVITSLMEQDDSVYDQFKEDKVKIIVRAMRIIYKVQANILKEL